MSASLTESVSRPGRNAASGSESDDRALFLTEFSGQVLEAYMEAVADYAALRFVKNITHGKSETFPTIGRKRDATDHIPGSELVGGAIDHGQIEITVDNILVDSVFIAEIDELLNHYSLAEPYSRQIGQSLGTTNCRRIAIMHVLASRGGVSGPDMPTPAYYWNAAILTDMSKLEEAHFLAAQYLLENDISGSELFSRLGHAQVLDLSRFTGIEGGPVTTGSGNRARGTIGEIAGIVPKGTNFIPKTNITTGLAKYRGDFSTTVGHISTRMAVGTLERRGMKMVMKEQEERLGTIIIGSMLNGHGKLRNECAIELASAANAAGGRTALT